MHAKQPSKHLAYLNAIPIDLQAILRPANGESGDTSARSPEHEELPAPIVLPALRNKSVTVLLDIGEAGYWGRCLTGFGSVEAAGEIMTKAVLTSKGLKEASCRLDGERARVWLDGST